MGKTAFATDNPLKKDAYEEKLFKEIAKEAYFERFSGEGEDNIVQVKRQLEKDSGDTIKYGYIPKISGDAKTEGETLEGNELSINSYKDEVTIAEYAQAVRDRGSMDRQRALFSIDKVSQDLLKVWGSEFIDQKLFTALQLSPTKVFAPVASTGAFTGYASLAAAKAAMDAANCKLTPAFISALKAWCQTGGGRQYDALRPVKVDGKNYYVLLVPTDVEYDLKQDSNFQTAQREAMNRSNEHPLFKGAAFVTWDGVVIHSHENMTIGSDAGSGSNVDYGQCAMLGAQSLLQAWGKRPTFVDAEFDYDREHGYSWQCIFGAKKPNFNSKDYGSVGVTVSRTNISGQ